MNRWLFAIALFWIAVGADAQPVAPAFRPTKPVTLIVPFAAGGGTDSVGRVVAKELGELWGQPVIVDNRVGASGIIGASYVASAPPDGHTLLLAFVSLAINPYLFAKMPYDTRTDLKPITTVGFQALALVASPKVAASDLKSLFDQARAKPGVLTFAHSEAMTRMAGERVFEFANVKLLSVPYKGGQWLGDLVSGVVDVGFTSLTSALPMAQADRIKVLAISGTSRSPLLPNVKTFREQGVPGLDEGAWVALFAPGRTPDAIVNDIYSDVMRVLAKPEVKARIGSYGIETGGEPPAEFSRRFLRDLDSYGETARKLNLQPE